jgi:hypothetical protein
LTELRDARVEHYEADMAITLEDKGVRTWTYTSIKTREPITVRLPCASPLSFSSSTFYAHD